MHPVLLGPLGLGMPELLILLCIALLIFGGAKLKGIGRGLGEAIHEFKTGMKGGEDGDKKPDGGAEKH